MGRLSSDLELSPPTRKPGCQKNCFDKRVHLKEYETLLMHVRFGVAAVASAAMTPGTELCPMDNTEYLFTILSQQGESR